MPAHYEKQQASGKTFPVLLYVYGGPHVQLVRNAYHVTAMARLQLYALLGYVVVMIDSIGSNRRGQQFEAHLYKRLTQNLEVQDQLDGLQHLKSVEGLKIDLSRVGVFGFSYGGSLTLIALSRFAHIFSAGCAGAPVTQWGLYDTAYTERYMGLPDECKDAYAESDITNQVGMFPEETGRLLLVHGCMDENVLVHHTYALVDALVGSAKPHEILLLPDERHGLRKKSSNIAYDLAMVRFFANRLRP
jgi:dipeptidyl-peptidase 9